MPFTEYIQKANELYAEIKFDPYHWIKNITSPWTPMTKKLADCRVALVAGGGMSLKSQTPYDPVRINDFSYREIPGDTRGEDIVINSVFFKHDDTDKDLNNLFPIEILQEMAKDGYIGDVSPVNYICGVGRLYEPDLTRVFVKQVLPEIAGKLKAANVDVGLFCCG
jgi:D-proline reductase (dithiol) PrdB